MTPMRIMLAAAGLAAGASLGLAGIADANPGTGSSSGSSTRGTPRGCPSGWTLNPSTGKCERNSSGLRQELPAAGWAKADPAFLEAAVLAHSGRYEKAIAAFDALGRPDDPYVLTYLGFSHRKLGHVDKALGYYEKALSIQPDYVRAREYLGEGYVALGRIGEAREQLAMIRAACGTDCEEYRTLEGKIAAHLGAHDG